MLHSVIKAIKCSPNFFFSLILLLIIPTQNLCSAVQLLKTNSLSTCMDSSQFTSSYFSCTYFVNNRSLSFDITSTSTMNGYVFARVYVIAYGLTIINETLNPCSLNFKQLCPITPGPIDTSGRFSIGESVSKQIPSIAYTVPDLDGIVRVSILNTTTLEQVACIEATLQNGKTVQQEVVGWVTAAIAGVALFTAGYFSMMGYSATSAHIATTSLSLFSYFQSVAIINMEAVDRVSPIASAWAQNYIWSMGIVRLGFMQTIFSWYVQATGGTPSTLLRTKVSIVPMKAKRALEKAYYFVSIFAPNFLKKHGNVNSSSDLQPLNTTSDFAIDATKSLVPADHLSSFAKRSSYSTSVTIRGIKRVAYNSKIEFTNFFLTGMVFYVFVMFCVGLALFAVKLIVDLLVRKNKMKHDALINFRQNWIPILKGIMYRFSLLGFPQVTIFCFWEFIIRDSPACIVFAVLALVMNCSLLIWGSFKIILLAKRSAHIHKTPAYILFSDPGTLNKWGFLYTSYNASRYYFITIVLTYHLFRACFISFAQSSGKTQGLAIFIVELFFLITMCVLKPFLNKSLNVLNIFIQVVCTLNAFFYMFFSNLFGQPLLVNGVMGVIFFVLNAAVSLILLITTIVYCVWAYFSRNPDRKYTKMNDDRASFIKDGFVASAAANSATTELEALGATAREGFDPFATSNSTIEDDGIPPYPTKDYSSSELSSFNASKSPAGGLAYESSYSNLAKIQSSRDSDPIPNPYHDKI